MHVVATAGHVDHGKSTLVRALTGMEPDRWAEERRRGMTIDLGFAWTTLPSGQELAFVDVPGHQRFIGNMLAGLGPAPAVLFVVAADEGWSRQSTEHLAAVDALGLAHGLLVVTRCDLADPDRALAEAAERISRSSLRTVPGVAVSGHTGQGLDRLRTELDRVVADLPAPDADARVRFWVDRAFTVRGSGTVVTGTLGAGTLAGGDQLELNGRRFTVRGLQSLGRQRDSVPAVARVALNLRGLDRAEVSRGDVLLTPDAWHWTRTLDVRLSARERLPAELVLHLGTAAIPVRVRALGPDHARLAMPRPLPVQAGDRAILRDPGRQSVAAGVVVLDADPPPLARRGAANARATALAAADGRPDPRAEVLRRGAVTRDALRALGVGVTGRIAEVRQQGDWLIAETTWQGWLVELPAAVDRWAAEHPLDPGMPLEAARQAVDAPERTLIPELARQAELSAADGRICRPGRPVSLGRSEPAVAELESRLASRPFAAPERHELAELRLGRRELAAAERAGRLLRITDDIVLLPDAPDRAVARLATLAQPFTLSEARQALGTTRRVAVPLLEYLDVEGFTERVDSTRRRVRYG
jgi:selenocysteine-specific elongation factor